MSQENFAGSQPISFTAAGAITRNAAVKLTSTGVVVTTAITEEVLGVALEDAASGSQVPVLTTPGSIATMKANAAIAAGAMVMPAASGAGNIATAAGATSITCGQAIDAAAALGDLIRVVLRPGVKSPANT